MFAKLSSLAATALGLLALTSCGEKGLAPPDIADYPMLHAPPPALPEGTPNEAMVILEMIEVEGTAFSGWSMENSLNPGQATVLRRAVQEWIHAGKGRIVDTVAVHCRSGQTGKTQSVREIIYPTGYKAPQKLPAVKADEEEKTAPESLSEPGPPAPRSFETRKVGTVLEVDALIKPDTGVIQLTLEPEFVHYFQNIDVSAGTSDVFSGSQSFPVFEKNALSTTISLMDGTYGFLGSGRLPDAAQSETLESSVLLVFVRADTNSG